MTIEELEKLCGVLRPMLNNTITNYIVPGLNSSLVGDGDKGGKVRIFHATRNTRDTITPHSHRFNFACLVLSGTVTNTIYEEDTMNRLGSEQWVKSTIDPVCGRDGVLQYTQIRADEPSNYYRKITTYRPGNVYAMQHDQIHSIVFSHGAVVLFFEGPELSKRSVMIEPWENGKVIPTFETRDWMFQKEYKNGAKFAAEY